MGNNNSEFTLKVLEPESGESTTFTSLTILRKMLTEENCNAHKFLLKRNIKVEKLARHIEEFDSGIERDIKNIIVRIGELVARPDHVCTDHLLLAIIDTKSCFASQLLSKFEIDRADLLEYIECDERELEN